MRNRWLLLGVVAAILPACGGGGGGNSEPVAAAAISDSGIETFPDEGNTHVPVGTVISYNTDPPTSGNHYPDPEPGGFYTTEIAPGFLVHSMEHGGIIIYYNASMLTPDDLSHLQDLATTHPGTFSQIVVVPRADPTYPIILTAWTHRLRLQVYDRTRIDGFVALFLGQGPEKQ